MRDAATVPAGVVGWWRLAGTIEGSALLYVHASTCFSSEALHAFEEAQQPSLILRYSHPSDPDTQCNPWLCTSKYLTNSVEKKWYVYLVHQSGREERAAVFFSRDKKCKARSVVGKRRSKIINGMKKKKKTEMDVTVLGSSVVFGLKKVKGAEVPSELYEVCGNNTTTYTSVEYNTHEKKSRRVGGL